MVVNDLQRLARGTDRRGNALTIIGVLTLDVDTNVINKPLNVQWTQVLLVVVHHGAMQMASYIPEVLVVCSDTHAFLVALCVRRLLRQVIEGN